MKSKNIPAIVIIVVLLAVLGGMAISAQENPHYRGEGVHRDLA